MPIKPGYSERTVRENVKILVVEGYPRDQAVAIALDSGRKSYFERFPEGFLPYHLRLIGGRGDRAAWEASKKRRRIRRADWKGNPIKDRQTRVNAAMKLYAAFSGHEPEVIGQMPRPKKFDVGIVVGELRGVAYETVRDGRVTAYFHEFNKDCRPLLVSSFDGKQLCILGGEYDFTENGIVDANDAKYSPRMKGKG